VILGVDVGGTFTDAVLLTGERLVTGKSPTTPSDQSEGVVNAVRQTLEAAGAEAGDVERFVHGMTVGTNALLEGEVARTALLATAGFRSGSASAVPPGRVPLEVSAAANLARVLPALAARYDQRHGRVSLLANYAGTQILLTQLEQGQSSDLFFSADLAHMRQAQREGIVRHYSVVSELSPVIIVPRSNPAGIRSLQDLGTRPVQLVIGVPTVPVGAYARTIFRNANAGYGANFYAQALSHVVSTETNTGEVTQQVASGQADAGVVYRSDIGPSIAARVSIIPIPPAYEVVAANYGAVVTHARHADQAQAFLAFITSPAGQELQRGFGYLPLAGATAAASLGAAGPTAALERRT